MTAALDALLSSPDRADTMGKRGRERAMREFRWDDRGAIFAERLDSLASAPARAEPRTNPPLVRLRREAGQASNRLASSASVLAEMLARGRLATYLVAQSDPQNVKAWVDEMLAWLDRAFAAGTDGGVSAGYHVAHGWPHHTRRSRATSYRRSCTMVRSDRVPSSSKAPEGPGAG